MAAEQVVLIRKYNDPVIHRPECRHLKGRQIGGPLSPLVDLTDAMRQQVEYGYLRVCRTCRPV